jgi:molybdopterin synthase sulfur carrier subunit
MATVSVKIPTPLRKFTAGKDTVEATGATVSQVLDNLEEQHPGIKSKLCDDAGKMRRFINLYANEDDIRFLDALDTEMKDGDTLSVVPAIAGGR